MLTFVCSMKRRHMRMSVKYTFAILFLCLLMGMLIGALIGACTRVKVDRTYSAEKCEALSVKIERCDSLTQTDYTDMIGQNEAILIYLAKYDNSATEVAGELSNVWKEQLAAPEFVEKTGFLSTLDASLRQAETEGKLNKTNRKLYKSLNKYNKTLGKYCEMD